jgi:hypothetical protein
MTAIKQYRWLLAWFVFLAVLASSSLGCITVEAPVAEAPETPARVSQDPAPVVPDNQVTEDELFLEHVFRNHPEMERAGMDRELLLLPRMACELMDQGHTANQILANLIRDGVDPDFAVTVLTGAGVFYCDGHADEIRRAGA